MMQGANSLETVHPMPSFARPFVTGNQIKAARALLGWRRSDLAGAAQLHVNAVAYWEGRQQLPAHQAGCVRIRDALFAAGIVAIDSPAPGVCFISIAASTAKLGITA